MWTEGLDDLNRFRQPASNMTDVRMRMRDHDNRIKDLEHHIGRLSLLNQALWEVLRGKLGLTDEELEKMAREVDLRDGVEDGQITVQPVECPACKRISNSRHYKCLYCGQLFEKLLFG